MSECIFCAIVDGKIPADIVHRDSEFVAFRDIAPKAPVHILVIPTEHHANVAEVAASDPSRVGRMVSLAHQIAGDEKVQDGYRLIFNTGAKGGQTVFHAHLHILAGAGMPGF